jgi:hypothetical protein
MGLQFRYLPEFPRRPLDEADLACCEQQIGHALPPRLRAFLHDHDGPAPDPGWICLERRGERTWLGPIHSFLSVMGPPDHRSRGNSIEAATYAAREGHKLPRRLIPFGSLLTQPSTLLISVGWFDYGAVYAWRVGMKRFRRNQLIRVAHSHEAFLELLVEPPPEIAEAHRLWLAQKAAARQAGAELRPPADEYAGPEARRWLRTNRNAAPLAANHFRSSAAALGFVDELYRLGASRVIVPESCLQDEDDDGPYADALVAFLPTDPQQRADVCRRCEQELDEPQRIDPADPNPIFLWWD